MTTSDMNNTEAPAVLAPGHRIMLLTTAVIRIDGGTQARAELNQATVAEYAEALAGGAEFPPVIVFLDGTDHWLADGFHRWHGHNTAGKASILAEVRTGTQRDARLFSFGANGRHGLRPSNADKRKAVLAMLEDEEWGGWADRVIARSCAVSHNFVSSLRRHLSSDDRCDAKAGAADPHATPTTRTVQRGGKVYQQKVREQSVRRAPAHEPSLAAASTVVPKPVDPSAIPENLTRAQGAQLAHQLREEDPEEFDTLAELEKSHAEVVRMQKEIDTLTADDTKAQLYNVMRLRDSVQRTANDAMDNAKRSQDREKWVMRQLMRCGKAVGENDPTKIAAKVEAMARAAQHEAMAKVRGGGDAAGPMSVRAAQEGPVDDAPTLPAEHDVPAVAALAPTTRTTVQAARVVDPAVAALLAMVADKNTLADDAQAFGPETTL